MKHRYKFFITAIIIISIIFNFFKILSFTGFWMLFNDSSANTRIVNDTQNEVMFVNIPAPSTLNSFYSNLFYTNAYGKIVSGGSKVIIFPKNERNNLLIQNGKEYLSTNLKPDDWAKKKLISNFNLLSIKSSNDFSSLSVVKKRFGLKVLISTVILLLTIFTIKLIYSRKGSWKGFTVGLLIVLSFIHFIFLYREIGYFNMLFSI